MSISRVYKHLYLLSPSVQAIRRRAFHVLGRHSTYLPEVHSQNYFEVPKTPTKWTLALFLQQIFSSIYYLWLSQMSKLNPLCPRLWDNTEEQELDQWLAVHEGLVKFTHSSW